MTLLPPWINPLTPRETECLHWASKGKTSWEIAGIVGCSERTVNYHISNVCAKLNVHGRQAAIALALLEGYLTPHGGDASASRAVQGLSEPRTSCPPSVCQSCSAWSVDALESGLCPVSQT